MRLPGVGPPIEKRELGGRVVAQGDVDTRIDLTAIAKCDQIGRGNARYAHQR